MLFTTAVASVLDYIWLPLAKNPYFVWLYVTVAIITTISGISFGFIFRHLNKEEDDWNKLDETSTNKPMPAEKLDAAV